MGSIIELDGIKRSRPATKCGVCHLLGLMADEERAELNGYLADPEVRYSDLSEAVAGSKVLEKRYGAAANLDRSQYARHARGACEARANLRPKARR